MGLPVIVLTSAGAALLAKTPIGASIPVTGWKIGNGALPAGTNLQNQTELVSPLAEAPIASVEPNENQCLITGQFVNTGMVAFNWEETGLFASDPDNGTILFAYGNSFGSGEAIPAGSSQLREIVFGAQLVFDVAPNITAVINQGLVFATLMQLNQRIPNSEKGEPNGVATLGADGKLSENQRPVYTGEDIPVSEEDDTDLKTALENKVSLGHGEPIDASTDLDALTELGVYTFVRTSIPMNAPPELTDGGKVYVVAANSGSALRQTIVSAYGIEYRRTQPDPVKPWLGWVKTAIASPLKEIDLPISVKVEGSDSKYCKDQFGRVSFNVYMTLGEALSDGSAIAVFPEGYRPSETQNFVMSGVFYELNTRFTGSFTVLNNGNLLLFESQDALPAGSIVFGSGSFLAAE